MSALIWDEDGLRAHVWPRFSRALARQEIYLANHSLGRPPDRMAEDVRAAWTAIYREPERFFELYELAEKLVDFEDYFRRWRFNHVTTVERVIGFKRGTGGTDGVAFLRKSLEVALFPELIDVRTHLG